MCNRINMARSSSVLRLLLYDGHLHMGSIPMTDYTVEELKAAMIDLAKNIGPLDDSRFTVKTREVWSAVCLEDYVLGMTEDD
jgi:hypothetical protein